MENKEIYISEPWEYSEKKDGKHLLVWPDLPKWIVTDNELFLLLKMFNGENTLDKIIDKISQSTSKNPSIIKKEINTLLPTLVKSSIIFEKDRKELTKKSTLEMQIEKEKYKLTDVVIHPTNRCNLHCKMCFNKYNYNPGEYEISTEEIKQFLDQTVEFISEDAIFSVLGGEPLLVPDKTLAVIKYAKNIGFNVFGVSTNGTLITREFAKKAKENEIEVQVSIDGANEKENDFLRGKGSFKKTIKGIKILTEQNVYTILSMVCHKGNFNYKSLQKYYEMALELGVDSARFIPFKHIGGGLDKELESVPVDELLKTSYTLFKNHPEYNELRGRDYLAVFANACRLSVKYGYCGTGLKSVLLNADGTIYPCPGHALPEFKVGNIQDNSFSEMWSNSPILKKLRKIYNIDNLNEKCSSCLVRNWCMGGCRGEAYHTTHTLNSPALQCDSIKKSIIEMFWLLSTELSLGRGDKYFAD
ncbi:MAG: radical SAM protein [Thermoplasmatales archaeon]|nr:radical SAM protein [Thermoplasmatales archaeon]